MEENYIAGLTCSTLFMALAVVTTVAHGQTSSASSDSGQSHLEQLVGPIALYPDDLLSIILPASTYPLQVVEADRWIQQNKDNADAQAKDSWDDSIKALLNYPDVLSMMSGDLEWTAAMGEAVATDQTAVMDSVQSFRRKAEGAGNLKSDDKQLIVVEEEVVKIVQADPQIIYVPQYEPQVVVVQQTVPVYPTCDDGLARALRRHRCNDVSDKPGSGDLPGRSRARNGCCGEIDHQFRSRQSVDRGGRQRSVKWYLHAGECDSRIKRNPSVFIS